MSADWMQESTGLDWTMWKKSRPELETVNK